MLCRICNIGDAKLVRRLYVTAYGSVPSIRMRACTHCDKSWITRKGEEQLKAFFAALPPDSPGYKPRRPRRMAKLPRIPSGKIAEYERSVADEFIELVKRVATERGISLSDIGLKTKVGAVSIHQLLSKRCGFTLWTMSRICYGLGIDIEFKVRPATDPRDSCEHVWNNDGTRCLVCRGESWRY